jgi:L-amino acid N-acyltransferase YncA
MRVREATEHDLSAIGEIYAREVRTGISTFDVEPPGLDYWKAKVDSREPGDHLLVAEQDRILGYAYSSSYRPRPAYRYTRETSVYLAADARGNGLGRLLYDDLLARLRADEVHTVVALIALPNPASTALHLACGFEQVGVLHEVGHKFGRWIDTAWFELRIR